MQIKDLSNIQEEEESLISKLFGWIIGLSIVVGIITFVISCITNLKKIKLIIPIDIKSNLDYLEIIYPIAFGVAGISFVLFIAYTAIFEDDEEIEEDEDLALQIKNLKVEVSLLKSEVNEFKKIIKENNKADQ